MKKRYVINFEDEEYNSVIARQGNLTKVQVGDDGPLESVNYHPVLGGKAISIRVRGKLHLVHLTAIDSKGTVAATINGRQVTLKVLDELRAQAMEGQTESAGDGTICADIPGLVVELKVSEGQKVEKGEPVIVVEAMKMQNELAADIAGTVTSIHVKPGQAVNPGDVLVTIEA